MSMYYITGHYMQLTGKPSTRGVGRLLSPTLTSASGGKCVSFYYRNLAANSSSLHVYAATQPTKNGPLKYSKRLYSGEVDPTLNQWKLARVPLPSNLKQYQVNLRTKTRIIY